MRVGTAHTLDYREMMHRARILAGQGSLGDLLGFRRAAMELALDGSEESAAILAEAYARPLLPLLRPAIGDALLALESGAAIRRAWACWMERRSDALAEILARRPLRLPCPVRLYVLSRLASGLVEELRREVATDVVDALVAATADQDPRLARAAATLVREKAGQPVTAERLARALVEGRHPRSTLEIARKALEGGIPPEAVDAIAAVWERTRHRGLGDLLRRGRRVASRPPALTAMTALAFAPEAIADPLPEMAPTVLAACGDRDPEVAGRALGCLRASGGAAWAAALGDAVLEGDCPPPARSVLATVGAAPRDPARRAVFLLLTDQVEAALSLDFDLEMLSEAYRTGAPALRRRLAAAIRRAGSKALTRVLVRRRGDDQAHLMLSEIEWEALFATLDGPGREDEIWSLLLDAPAAWSVMAFDRLRAAGWLPPEGDHSTWERLAAARGRIDPGADWTFLERRREPERVSMPVLAFRSWGVMRAVGLGPVVVAGGDEGLRLFSPADGIPLPDLPGALPRPRVIVFSGDGRRVALGIEERFQVWDLGARTRVADVRAEAFDAMALSWDGTRLVTQHSMGEREIHHLARERRIRMAEGRRFDEAALSPDGRRLAISRSSEWRLYAVDPRRAVGTFTLLHEETMQPGARQPCFTPDGRNLLVFTRRGVDIHDAETGRRKGHLAGVSWNPAFAPEGGLMALESESLERGNGVSVWDVGHWRQVRRFDLPLAYRQGGNGPASATRALAFSPDGRTLRALTWNGTVLSWPLCATPLAAHPLGLLWHAEEAAAKGPQAGQWAYVAAVMGHRARYDIELEDEAAFMPGPTDVEIELS